MKDAPGSATTSSPTSIGLSHRPDQRDDQTMKQRDTLSLTGMQSATSLPTEDETTIKVTEVVKMTDQKPLSMQAPSSDTEWSCSQCTLVNAPTAMRCAACDKLKGGKTAQWVCAFCNLLNNPQESSCIRCKRRNSPVVVPHQQPSSSASPSSSSSSSTAPAVLSTESNKPGPPDAKAAELCQTIHTVSDMTSYHRLMEQRMRESFQKLPPSTWSRHSHDLVAWAIHCCLAWYGGLVCVSMSADEDTGHKPPAVSTIDTLPSDWSCSNDCYSFNYRHLETGAIFQAKLLFISPYVVVQANVKGDSRAIFTSKHTCKDVAASREPSLQAQISHINWNHFPELGTALWVKVLQPLAVRVCQLQNQRVETMALRETIMHAIDESAPRNQAEALVIAVHCTCILFGFVVVSPGDPSVADKSSSSILPQDWNMHPGLFSFVYWYHIGEGQSLKILVKCIPLGQDVIVNAKVSDCFMPLLPRWSPSFLAPVHSLRLRVSRIITGHVVGSNIEEAQWVDLYGMQRLLRNGLFKRLINPLCFPLGGAKTVLHLPVELLISSLGYLTSKDLGRLACVSRACESAADMPLLWKLLCEGEGYAIQRAGAAAHRRHWKNEYISRKYELSVASKQRSAHRRRILSVFPNFSRPMIDFDSFRRPWPGWSDV